MTVSALRRTPTRLALIGAGAIAAAHAATISETDALMLTRVIDRHPERAQALAATYDAEASTDPGGLFADDIDAVVVCTSPDSHVDLGIAALNAGKALLIEKPAALDMTSLEQLLKTAADTGLPLMVAQTARFQPANLEVGRAVAAGQIGRPRLVHVSWYGGHVWPRAWRAWQLDESRCGGHLVHNGVHALDLATWLLDDVPRRVFARPLRTWASAMPTPDSFHIIAEYRNGAQAVIEISYGLARGSSFRRVYVAGTGGSIAVATHDEVDTEAHPRVSMAGVGDPVPPALVGDSMRNQYRHFRDVVHGAVPSTTTPDQIRGTLAAALAATRSTRTGSIETAWSN